MTQVGGQAVIEGVMMRCRNRLSIAVRKPDDEILLHEEELRTAGERWPLLRFRYCAVWSLLLRLWRWESVP
jgi:uncharacterized protein YqhQ